MTDIVTAITRDHREVEALFDQFATANPGPARRDVLDRLRVSLAKHATAEEILVYPAVRATGDDGGSEARDAIDEHQEIKRLLASVDGMDGADPALAVVVDELRQAVAHHVAEEEGALLPTLAAGTSADRLARMGELFDRMKPLLPTHPHPGVPGTATAQLLAGPLASVADHVRDLIARR